MSLISWCSNANFGLQTKIRDLLMFLSSLALLAEQRPLSAVQEGWNAWKLSSLVLYSFSQSAVLHPGLCVDTNSWISHVFLIILPDFQFVFLSKIVLRVNQNLRVIAFGQ